MFTPTFYDTSCKLEEMAIACVVGDSTERLLRKLKKRHEGEDELNPIALVLLTGRKRLARLLNDRIAARRLHHMAVEIAEGRLNLRRCSAKDLEELPGWSMEMARLFLLHCERPYAPEPSVN